MLMLRSFCSVLNHQGRGELYSEDFSLLVTLLLVTFSWLFRGFFVALICLEKQCLGVFRGFSVAFS